MNATSFLLVVLGLTLFLFAFAPRGSGLANRLRARKALEQTAPAKNIFRQSEILLEMPDFVALIGFAVSAGESLESALRIAISRSNGVVGAEFEKLISNVDLGAVLGVELEKLAISSSSEQIRELAAKLALASANGTAVSELIDDFALSSIQELKAYLLARAGKNETKMMIPLVFVILPITVMFAVFPSLTLIQSSLL